MKMSFAQSGGLLLSGVPLVLVLGWYLGAEMRLPAQPANSSPAPPLTTAPLRAAALHYRQYCARCHGDDYTGRARRERGRRIPDFTNGAWQKSRTDAQLLVSVLEGKGAVMPAFNDKLSKEQACSLVSLIRKASLTRPATAEVAPTDFTRRYAELIGDLEELRKQYREVENGRSGRGPQAQDGARTESPMPH